MNGKENPETTGLEIAIIGMAGRFPGAKNIAEFWHNIKKGVEAISFFSSEELETAGFSAEVVEKPNFVKAGGLMEDIDLFDSNFFGYIPYEAEVMDPQTRIFHECCWSALEDAGCEPGSYDGLIGLYAGSSHNFNWEAFSIMTGMRDKIDSFMANCLTTKDFLCSLVSYKLNLRGPSVFMNTACSTSLVTVHMACQAILNGECDMALAGGAAVPTASGIGYVFQEGMIYSPDGHCRAFDAAAQGTVSGEGIGIVVLKRLEDAVNNRDHIYAVVKGSAVNNDGIRKLGYTAPSIEGQVEVIKTARQIAEVEPESIGYIEAHGTGTNLGDPVELEALKLAFETNKRNYCGIGSVKSNIGHCDTAAGIAGFIKAVLALVHRQIPPTLHFENLNPAFKLEESPFYINAKLRDWENNGALRRAGVSSFGIGGTNAHVILEEYKPEIRISKHDTNSNDQNVNVKNKTHTAKVFGGVGTFLQKGSDPPEAEENEISTPELILLSAKTSTALERNTKNLSEYFKEHPGINLADAAYTLQSGRSNFNHRRMVVCSDAADAAAALSDPGLEKVRTNLVKEGKKPVVFMFSGQGSQYVNMGLELYRNKPLFREEIDTCFEILRPIMGNDIKEILYPAPGKEKEAETKINDAVYTGPIKFIFEYAVAKLLIKWGIKPQAMIGHSFGEYVVACLAGVLPLKGALELVALRGKLMMKMPAGAMMSVPLPEEEVKPLLNKDLSLAAVNTPSLCIVSGTSGAVNKFEQEMKEKGQECLLVNFPRASHSNMMQLIVAEFVSKARQIELGKPRIPYISGLSGRWITAAEAGDPGYWGRHLAETVRFSDGIKELLKEPGYIFIQVGCDKGLPLFVSHHLDLQAQNLVINMVKHKKDKMSDYLYFLNQLGQLWLSGLPVDWREFYAPEKRRRIPLPTYSFEQQNYMTKGNPFGMAVERLSGVSPGRKSPTDWFYIPSWLRTRQPLQQDADIEDLSPSLVFLDEDGFGVKLADRLKKVGRQVFTVTAGAGFRKKGDRDFTVNPGIEKDYDSLVSEIRQEEKPVKQVFHLWNVDRPSYKELEIDRLNTTLERSLYSLVYLVRAFGAKGISETMRIEVITNNMQDVAGEEFLYPGKAAVIGAVRVIPLEFNNIGCRSIDITLPPPGSEQEKKLIDLVLNETRQETFVQVLAFRGNERWEQTLKPVKLEKSEKKPLPLKEGGVYLITGGLGGIGLEIARFLAQKVKAKLILSGRSALPEGKERKKWLDSHEKDNKDSIKIRKVDELEKLGAEVLVMAADVTDDKQVQELLSRAKKRFGTINGVIHSAGIPGGGSIQLKTREKLAAAVDAKLKGTVILDSLLRDYSLDFFILCSSGNSFAPIFGQVDYCAANAFLDAFANYNTNLRGRFTQSVNWDRWRNTGMAVAVEKKHKQNTGSEMTGGITAREGIAAFEITLQNPYPQIIVCTRDLRVDMDMRKQRVKRVEKPVSEEQETGAVARENLRQRPELSTTYTPPGNEIEQKLAELFQNFFGIEKIGINDDFFELGGDSLKALTIIAHIKSEVNPNITLSDLLLHPTIRELAAGSREPGRFDKLECIVPLNKCDKEKNIFIIHPLHGMVYQYKDLANLLEDDFNVYGIQARGIVKNSKLPETLDQIVEDYIQQIRAIQENGPYIIAGYCFGDMIGYNLVKRLEDMRIQVEKFIMLDEMVFLPPKVMDYYRQERLFNFLKKPLHVLLHLFRKKTVEKNPGTALDKPEEDERKKKELADNEITIRKSKIKAQMNIHRLNKKYWRGSAYKRATGIIKAPLLAIKARDTHFIVYEEEMAKMTLGKVTFVETPGDHDTLFEYPQVEQLAEIMRNNV